MRVKLFIFQSRRGEPVTHLELYNSKSPYQLLGAFNIYGDRTRVYYKDADENSCYNGPINGASNIIFEREMEEILDKISQENEKRNRGNGDEGED